MKSTSVLSDFGLDLFVFDEELENGESVDVGERIEDTEDGGNGVFGEFFAKFF